MDTGEMYTDDDDDDESPSEDGEPSIDADEIFTDDDDDSPSADGEPSMSPSGDGRADCSQIQGKELMMATCTVIFVFETAGAKRRDR
ncbi:hypothetical protein GBA52_021672 [Prunus armeniaca]|nr:hypothetical protein GBA52_021672 [Prunus armeniaca]